MPGTLLPSQQVEVTPKRHIKLQKFNSKALNDGSQELQKGAQKNNLTQSLDNSNYNERPQYATQENDATNNSMLVRKSQSSNPSQLESYQKQPYIYNSVHSSQGEGRPSPVPSRIKEYRSGQGHQPL